MAFSCFLRLGGVRLSIKYDHFNVQKSLDKFLLENYTIYLSFFFRKSSSLVVNADKEMGNLF